MATIPATPWTANSTSPYADQSYQAGDRAPPPSVGLTVVNFAQVDVVWDSSSTTMTLVERAEAEIGPYVTEAWDEAGVSSRRLNNHLPSTTYYYRIRRVGVGGSVTETVALGSATTPAATRSFYVSTIGNDSNDGLSLGNAFLNINKFHTLAAAGDICYIKAGTYSEDAEAFNALYGGLTIADTGDGSVMQQTQLDGTEANPIVMRAYDGDETLVIFDGEVGTATFNGSGIMTDVGSAVRGVRVNNSFWQFYGLEIKEMLGSGIGCNVQNASDPALETAPVDTSIMPSDVVVENCWIHGINSQTGTNSAPVWPWGGQRWVIRNLRLDDSYQATGTRGNGIQWYGALDMTIENVKITNAENCIQMKDHYVLTVGPRTTGLEATISSCDFDARANGISMAQRGASSNEAGSATVRHTLSRGASGILWNPSANTTLDRQSNTIDVAHCTLDSSSGRDFTAKNTIGGTLFGNIFITGDVRFSQSTWDGSTWETRLNASDYNAFNSSTMDITIDSGSPQEAQATTLVAWQAFTDGGYTLTFDNPDPNSAAGATGTLVTDASADDYSVPGTSVASGLLSDGSDAGIYRFGGEIIGLLPTFYWGAI